MSDSCGKFLDGKKISELVLSKLRQQKAKVNFILLQQKRFVHPRCSCSECSDAPGRNIIAFSI
ncbi:MAG: hypothetical protein ACXWE6_14155 [Nitrososphaeraceae archaeon]